GKSALGFWNGQRAPAKDRRAGAQQAKRQLLSQKEHRATGGQDWRRKLNRRGLSGAEPGKGRVPEDVTEPGRKGARGDRQGDSRRGEMQARDREKTEDRGGRHRAEEVVRRGCGHGDRRAAAKPITG